MISKETKECKIIFLGIKCDNLAIDAGECGYLSPLWYFLYGRWYLYIKKIFLNYNAQTLFGSLYMATDQLKITF